MRSKKLFICEKPAQVKDVLKRCGNPEDDGLVFFAIGSFLFDYSNHSLLELPVLPEKSFYKYISNNKLNGVVYNYKTNGFKKEKESLLLSNALKSPHNYKSEVKKFFSQYEEIVLAMDFDHTGVRGVVQHFSRLLGFHELKDIFKNYNISIINNYIYPISDALDKRFEESNYKNFLSFEEYFIKHDYEEYVFNLNSYNFFHSVFENFQILNEKNKVFTRNHIYALSEFVNIKNKLITENCFLSVLGKKNIGSIISRYEILENLLDIGFLKKENNTIYLTEEGSFFYNKVKNIKLKTIDDILFSFEFILKEII